MEFAHLFFVLRSRWWLLLLTTALVLAAAVSYRVASPGTYRAVASVVVDPRGINPVSGRATQETGAQDSVLGTYANIARSEGIARRVLGALPDALQSRLRTQWQTGQPAQAGDFETWGARRLMREVDVRAGGQSSHVLDISFSDRNREQAALIANTYAATLIQYSREMRVVAARKDADYFRVQAAALRQQTEEAERRLAAFQREHGITSADDRMDVETARLAALNAQAITNQDLSYDSSSRARQAASSNASPDIVNNPLVQSLTAEVARKEARLQELSGRLGANHPDMATARAQVEEARTALSRESRNVASALSTGSMVAGSRAASLRRDSEIQRQKVIELNSLRVELSSLDKDVGQKRKLYEAALQRSTETGLEAGSQRDDLMQLTEAFPPDGRAGPGLSVLLALAAMVGLLIGTLLSIAMDWIRPRLHRPVELEQLGIPVLQVVPVAKFGTPPAHGRFTGTA